MKENSKYKSIEEEYGMIDPEGKPFEIPVQGSMALLALGYRGLMAWRAKKIEAGKIQKKGKTENGQGQ